MMHISKQYDQFVAQVTIEVYNDSGKINEEVKI